MQVQRVKTLEELLPFAQRWDQLAGDCPFRSWAWLSTWWKHYGTAQGEIQSPNAAKSRKELFVLLVSDDRPPCHAPSSDQTDQRLIAVAPLYLERTLTRGNLLRMLGDGETCSDHLSLLVAEENTDAAAEAVAEYLQACSADWDLLNLEGIEAADRPVGQLCDALRSRGCLVEQTPSPQRWEIALPDDWEAFLAMQSKSHRKQLRKYQRNLIDTDRIEWHQVGSPDEFDTAWKTLVNLHQRRRNSLGEPGCFASQQFASFHEDIARQLLETGRLQLSWTTLDGVPAAAEYLFSNNTTTYAYQSGLDPDRSMHNLGQISLIKVIQHAIDSQHTRFDLLRGDEPYKAHWRAEPNHTLNIQIVPDRTSARWRYQSWSQLRRAKRWAGRLVSSK